MSEAPYENLRRMLSRLLQAELATGKPPTADYIRILANSLNASEEIAARLVADLCAPQVTNEVAASDAAPFLLIRLGEDLRPGAHLSPEFHLLHAGWDGEVLVESTIDGALDRSGWQERPRLTEERNGYWIFHQALPLTVNGAPCPCGEYRLEFECRFFGSALQSDSTWRGWIRFRVVDHGASGPTLEVVSDGQGLVNLHGLDLKRFSCLRFEARDKSLVNLQSFLAAVEQVSPDDSGKDSSQPSMIPVTLRLLTARFAVKSIPRPTYQARLDLPGGRRVLLFAQNSVMLGRNRPHSSMDEPTDIALRMLPRSEFHDSLTRSISQQHLSVSVADGRVTLGDPRRAESRNRFPAFVNRIPLGESRSAPPSARAMTYTTTLGDRQSATDLPPQIGLEIHTFSETDIAHDVQTHLRTRSPKERGQGLWLRDAAEMDAVLIERAANTDDLNGQEAYLLVLGVVLIGRDVRCPIRVDDPGIRDLHAVLCHWEGHFRVLPVDDAPVRCGPRSLTRGECATLQFGSMLCLGEVKLSFDKPLQIGLA